MNYINNKIMNEKEYQKKYYELNKEKRLKYKKEHYEVNKDKVKKYQTENREKRKIRSKKYRDENKDKIREKRKIYYNCNKIEINKRVKEYHKTHKSEIKEKAKQYYSDNKEKKKEYRNSHKEEKNEYYKKRRQSDNMFKLKHSIRDIIGSSLRRKSFTKKLRTQNILGCSFEEFKIYLESKFEPWMSWENKGKYNGELNYGWDIDHIIPLAPAKTEDEIIKLNHYTNLQPLCSYVNRHVKK